MRRAQQSMDEFVKLIDWEAFRRKNLNKEVLVSEFACADKKLAILWLFHTDCGLTIADGLEILTQEATQVQIPGMVQGKYRITY